MVRKALKHNSMLLVQPLCDIRLSGLVMINAFFEIYAHLSRMQCRILVADSRNGEIASVKRFAHAPMNMRQIISILLYEGNEAIFLAMGYTCVRGAT